MLRDEFSESGNLTDLVNALASAGSTGYTLSQGVNDVITALKFNSD